MVYMASHRQWFGWMGEDNCFRADLAMGDGEAQPIWVKSCHCGARYLVGAEDLWDTCLSLTQSFCSHLPRVLPCRWCWGNSQPMEGYWWSLGEILRKIFVPDNPPEDLKTWLPPTFDRKQNLDPSVENAISLYEYGRNMVVSRKSDQVTMASELLICFCWSGIGLRKKLIMYNTSRFIVVIHWIPHPICWVYLQWHT